MKGREKHHPAPAPAPELPAALVELPPLLRKPLEEPRPAGGLALEQAPRNQRDGGIAEGVGERLEARLGRDRVLVVAQEVLEVLGALDESTRRLARDGLGQLGGVTSALHLDAHGVEILVCRRVAEALDRPGQASERALAAR